MFGSLPTNNYKLMFHLLPGYVFSPQDVGPDDTVDSDANPATGMTVCFPLPPGTIDLSWDAGMYLDLPQEFKWEQPPDLSPLGMDVMDSHPFLLADDFRCTATGFIDEIWVWASWFQDYLPFEQDPLAMDFVLSLHADIPAEDNPNGYSTPGEPLWWMGFPAASFEAMVWEGGIEEGWMEPPDFYIFPGDWTCWLYRFRIPEGEQFLQLGMPEAPVVYWLDVQAHPHDPAAMFGWKTSFEHWNDDAVWALGDEPYPGPWEELRYPPPHPLAGESVDLAFRIAGPEIPGEFDFGDAPDPTYETLGASNGARHLIVPPVWLGNAVDGEPNGLPDPAALGDDNTGIDDEDGVQFLTTFSPGGTAIVRVTLNVAAHLGIWIDWAGDGSWAQPEDTAMLLGLPAGVHDIPIDVPAMGLEGHPTFARFRMSTAPVFDYRGPMPDGEVEDYEIYIEEDLTEVPELPQSFGLHQNVPNPFNPQTEIRYDVPAGGAHATLEIFDPTGRRVTTLLDGFQPEGRHRVMWRAEDDRGKRLPSGVYFYRFRTEGFVQTRKMLLLQ
jgi:hypothetical protein